jgi:hypothetical protein
MGPTTWKVKAIVLVSPSVISIDVRTASSPVMSRVSAA